MHILFWILKNFVTPSQKLRLCDCVLLPPLVNQLLIEPINHKIIYNIRPWVWWVILWYVFMFSYSSTLFFYFITLTLCQLMFSHTLFILYLSLFPTLLKPLPFLISFLLFYFINTSYYVNFSYVILSTHSKAYFFLSLHPISSTLPYVLASYLSFLFWLNHSNHLW